MWRSRPWSWRVTSPNSEQKAANFLGEIAWHEYFSFLKDFSWLGVQNATRCYLKFSRNDSAFDLSCSFCALALILVQELAFILVQEFTVILFWYSGMFHTKNKWPISFLFTILQYCGLFYDIFNKIFFVI